MEAILKDFPQFEFISGSFFMWSPHAQAIVYDIDRVQANDGQLALIHEIGHGLLGHRIYKFDMQLIQMELDAWELTRTLAKRYNIEVDEQHIASCINSYDSWLTKRATCPDCQNFCLQRARDEYSCFVCGSIWQVNWRKDRRVTRRVVERYEHPILGNAHWQ